MLVDRRRNHRGVSLIGCSDIDYNTNLTYRKEIISSRPLLRLYTRHPLNHLDYLDGARRFLHEASPDYTTNP